MNPQQIDRKRKEMIAHEILGVFGGIFLVIILALMQQSLLYLLMAGVAIVPIVNLIRFTRMTPEMKDDYIVKYDIHKRKKLRLISLILYIVIMILWWLVRTMSHSPWIL